MSTVLHHLQNASEVPFGITHSHINDIDKETGFIDPKLHLTLLASSKLLYDFLHNMDALWRVAFAYLSTNHLPTTREYSMGCIGIELD